MKYFIDTRSGVPIYRQLVQQIEKGIAGGILKAGDQLPTVREVALMLTINPNTVARAYRELESDGIIKSVQGRGTFIASGVVPGRDKKEIVRQHLTQLIREAQQMGMTERQLKEVVDELLIDWSQGGDNDE